MVLLPRLDLYFVFCRWLELMPILSRSECREREPPPSSPPPQGGQIDLGSFPLILRLANSKMINIYFSKTYGIQVHRRNQITRAVTYSYAYAAPQLTLTLNFKLLDLFCSIQQKTKWYICASFATLKNYMSYAFWAIAKSERTWTYPANVLEDFNCWDIRG